MVTRDWIIAITGALLASAGFALLAWALLTDRLHTRRLRRAGSLRRCRRCWYDMSAVAGLRCPECGREAKRERVLHRSRRRWRWAAAAMAVAAAGLGAAACPDGRNGGWKRWIPNEVLVACVAHTGADWPWEEMRRRIGLLNAASEPVAPFHLSDRQWDSLIESSVRVLESQGHILDPAAPIRAASLVDQRLHQLPPEILGRLSIAPGVTDPAPTVLITPRLIGAELAARDSPRYYSQLNEARAIELDPVLLAERLAPCSLVQLSELYRRLGISTPSPRWWGDTPNAPLDLSHFLAAERLRLDDDDATDCLLHVEADEGWSMESLVFLRQGEAWRCVGKIPYCAAPQTPLSSRVIVGDGPRWIVDRFKGVSHPGFRVSARDSWYRVTSSGVLLEQDVSLGPFTRLPTSALERSIEIGTPTVAEVDGVFIARYELAGKAELRLPLPPQGDEWRGIVWQRIATVEFPLDADAPVHGVPLAPLLWDGRPPEWYLECTDAELLDLCEESLRAHLRGGDDAFRKSLRLYLGTPERSPDLQRLRDALKDDL